MSAALQAFKKEKELRRREKDEETIAKLRHELRMSEAQNEFLREVNTLLVSKMKEIQQRQAREIL
jgi:hypothetical protein